MRRLWMVLPTSLGWDRKARDHRGQPRLGTPGQTCDGVEGPGKDGTPRKGALWADVGQKESGQKGGPPRKGVRGGERALTEKLTTYRPPPSHLADTPVGRKSKALPRSSSGILTKMTQVLWASCSSFAELGLE